MLRHRPPGHRHARRCSPSLTGLALSATRSPASRRLVFPVSGQWQPDRAGRQGGRLRADRSELHRAEVLPSAPVGDHRAGPEGLDQDHPGARTPLTTPAAPTLARPPRRWWTGSRTTSRKLQAENPGAPVPGDLVTTSASGLDPDISPGRRASRSPRVAKARGMSLDSACAIWSRRTRRRACSACSASRVSTCWRSTWRWTPRANNAPRRRHGAA